MTIDATKPKLLETYDAAGNRPASRIGLTKDGKEIVLTFPYDAAKVDIVRNLPRRRFDRDAKQWMIPATAEGMDGARQYNQECRPDGRSTCNLKNAEHWPWPRMEATS